MFALARRLKEAGVLGINRRNADYILIHNQRRFYPLVDDKALTKKIKSAVTDTGREVRAAEDKPGITNLLTILSVCTGRTVAELEGDYEGKGYGDFKGDVAAAVVELFAPVRERYAALVEDPAGLDAVLARGAARAREVAASTMHQVRDRIGLLAPAEA